MHVQRATAGLEQRANICDGRARIRNGNAELIETVFPHPTLSEMMHESVLGAYGRAIHF